MIINRPRSTKTQLPQFEPCRMLAVQRANERCLKSPATSTIPISRLNCGFSEYGVADKAERRFSQYKVFKIVCQIQ